MDTGLPDTDAAHAMAIAVAGRLSEGEFSPAASHKSESAAFLARLERFVDAYDVVVGATLDKSIGPDARQKLDAIKESRQSDG